MGAINRLYDRVTTAYASQAGVTLGKDPEPFQLVRSREIIRGRVRQNLSEARKAAPEIQAAGLGGGGLLPLAIGAAALFFLLRGKR